MERESGYPLANLCFSHPLFLLDSLREEYILSGHQGAVFLAMTGWEDRPRAPLWDTIPMTMEQLTPGAATPRGALRRGKASPSRRRSRQQANGRPGAAVGSRGPELSVLIIDDYSEIRAVVRQLLEKEFPGLRAEEISGENDFRLALRRGDFDLVVTDYHLSWSNGLACLRAVKSEYPDRPVIMFTGAGAEEIAVQAMKSGLDDYVIKSPEHLARLPAVVRSVLENVKERRARQEAEHRYRDLFSGVPIGLFLVAPDGRFLDANPALLKLFACPDRETLLRENLIETCVDPTAQEQWKHLMQRQGRVRNFEFRLQRRDGKTIWVRMNARAERDDRGRVRFFEGSVEDVTKHREAEGKIRESRAELGIKVKERTAELLRANELLRREAISRKHALKSLGGAEANLRNIISQMADSILIIDEKGIVRFVNPAAEGLFKRKAGEFLGKSFGIPLVPGGIVEIGIGPRDGSMATAEIRVAPIKWKNKIAYIASLRDITERKKIEQVKDEFIEVVSHELRTPLSSMRIAVGQVADGIQGGLHPAQKEILAIVLEEIDRLTRIVNNLLDVSKIETGRTRLKRAPLRLLDLLEKTVGIFEESARKLGLTMELRSAAAIPVVFADADRLEQVLANLIGNALKFTPRGGKVWIEAGVDRGFASCSVSDNGIGIPLEHLEAVFAKFTRFAPSPAGEPAGSGLGLAIARKLVTMHGGRIWAESQPGKGSKLTFLLPDCTNADLLRKHLAERMERLGREKASLSLVGVALQNSPEPKQSLGEKFGAFVDQFRMVLDEMTEPQTAWWNLSHPGEFLAVFERKDEKEGQAVCEHLQRRFGKAAFLLNGTPLSVRLSFAAAYPELALGEEQLLEALHARLSRAEPLLVGSRRKTRVLIADDDTNVVDVISHVLEMNGIEPVKAYDGEEALDLIAKEIPDLIILDIVMPKMGGYEVIHHLRKGKGTAEIPLLIISAYDIDGMRLMKNFGSAIPSITKPFDLNQLMALVRKQLRMETIAITC